MTKKKLGKTNTYPDSYIYSSDVREVGAKSGERLGTQNRVPVTDLIKRENGGPRDWTREYF
jgi:hypothetical protein